MIRMTAKKECKACLLCGKEFICYKSAHIRFCSRSCGTKYARSKAPQRQMATCHPDRKQTAHGLCLACYDTRRYTSMSYEELKARRVRYATTIKASKLSKQTGRPYEVVKEEVTKLLATSTACEICETTNDLCIDHDHKTGFIRGILCRKHNTLLGFAGEDHDVLRNAIRYLMRKEMLQYGEYVS